MDSQDRPKRTDVGYKRPPVETRFKKGQKPPPQKKKRVPKGDNTRHLFWAVLQEPRRTTSNGKARWVTTAELVVRMAYIEAERGSSTLQRLLNQLLLGKAKPDEDEMPEVVIEP